jgi:hypothetical protein
MHDDIYAEVQFGALSDDAGLSFIRYSALAMPRSSKLYADGNISSIFGRSKNSPCGGCGRSRASLPSFRSAFLLLPWRTSILR